MSHPTGDALQANCISPSEAARRMRNIFEPHRYDAAGSREAADGILCEVLMSLGYTECVDIYRRMVCQ